MMGGWRIVGSRDTSSAYKSRERGTERLDLVEFMVVNPGRTGQDGGHSETHYP